MSEAEPDMFSSRTDWDFRPSPLFSLVQQKRARGDGILDLTESNPTRCGFPYQPHLLIDPDSLNRSVSYEPDPKGLLSAREAIAQWYQRQHKAVSPDQIILTSGTSEAYSFLFRLLCNNGDSIAVPCPSYPLFDYLCRLNDVESRHYNLAYDGEWHIESIPAEPSFALGLKAFVVLHPNNPTGSFVKKDERDRILSFARNRAVSLIVDEVFHTFSFGNDARRAESFAGTKDVLTFTVNGLSKLAGLPQMKLAWIVVSGPADEYTKAMQRLEVVADTYLSVGTPVQHALRMLLDDPAGIGGEILKRVRSNYELLSAACPPNTPLSLLRNEGGWNAVLRLPGTKTDEEWAQEILRQQSVLTHPGHLFDFDDKSCLVVSLLPEPGAFGEGIRRIAATVMQ
jgi:alanine-synthesizing transaminase